jgi:hypothetical protein
MIVALSAIRVTLDGRRQAEPCPHCRRGGLQGSRRPGVDEFGRLLRRPSSAAQVARHSLGPPRHWLATRRTCHAIDMRSYAG